MNRAEIDGGCMTHNHDQYLDITDCKARMPKRTPKFIPLMRGQHDKDWDVCMDCMPPGWRDAVNKLRPQPGADQTKPVGLFAAEAIWASCRFVDSVPEAGNAAA